MDGVAFRLSGGARVMIRVGYQERAASVPAGTD